LIVLLTHLLNVGLLFLIIRGLTSTRLACFGAALWGAASVNEGALGWYQAYGVVLAVSAQLWIVHRLVQIRRTGRLSWLEVLSWVLLLFGASTCFGTGIAITMAMPGVAWLMLPATPTRRRATIGLTWAAVCVAAGYFGFQQLSRHLFPELPRMNMLNAALVRWPTVVLVASLMMMHGLASLLLGPLAHLASVGGWGEWTLSITALMVVGTAFVVARADARRLMFACLLPFGIGYLMIAAGRAAFWDAAGEKLIMQEHYHYTAPLPLAILTALMLADLGRRWRLSAATANILLALWVVTFATVQLTAGRAIDHHDWERELAEKELAQIGASVLSQPAGSDVYIKNRRFFGVGPFVIKNLRNFPGIAGLFAVYYPDQLLEGRRVFFVEPDPSVRRKLGDRPFGAMLVSPDVAPADRILNLPQPRMPLRRQPR
jgi:hypothetical protein